MTSRLRRAYDEVRASCLLSDAPKHLWGPALAVLEEAVEAVENTRANVVAMPDHGDEILTVDPYDFARLERLCAEEETET